MRSKPFSRNSASSPLHGQRRFKHPQSPAKYLVLGLFLFLVCGCAPKPEPKIPLSDAQKKFEQKCREEFELHVITRMVGDTLWIYLPIKEPIFDYEAQKENSGEDAEKKPAKFAVQYVDGNFKNGRFAFEYDVVTRKKIKTEDYGYSSSYTDNYVKQQNNLFTAVSEVFFNVELKKGQVQPAFMVVVITDIKKGIETRMTFFLQDFERYMTGDLPYDEYMKRFLADTKGGQSLIGDEVGSHVQFKEVTMPDFLAKQIINRINFKFQRSDFSPPDNYDDTIVAIVADTTRYYKFDKFTDLQLHNLRLDKKFLFDKSQLASFGEDAGTQQKPAPQGKLIHIRFDNGKAQFTDQ